MRSARTLVPGLLVVALAAVALAAPARADTVTDWNVHATNALATAMQPPPVATIHLAMVHGAVYDAVNAIDRRHQPYLVKPRARRWYSKDAAAATAAYRVLASIVPAQQPALQAQLTASLASIPDGRAESSGIAVGEAAAAAMIAARTNDGRFGSFRFPVGTEPGQWRPVLPMFVNDPNAWVAYVEPFVIPAQSHFGSDGPYDVESRKYAREFDEVKRLGSATSAERTADQTDAARFWAEGPIIITRAVRELSTRFCLKTADNARLFAMLYLTGADSLISVWYDKVRWLFWRPITAIHEAGVDGNPATEADPGWLPLVNNPPYPEHPSGLVGVTSAMAETLEDFFGTDRVAFSAASLNSGTTRTFGRFSDMTEEVVDARVWSGIHFRNADEDAARIGKEVARWRDKHFFDSAR
jgi:hypothetical protein